MTPLAVLHALSFPSLLAVVISGLLTLSRHLRRLMPFEFIAVIGSIGAAGNWIAASWLMADIAACRADATLCLFGTIYQLLRNLAFLLFYIALRRRISAAN